MNKFDPFHNTRVINFSVSIFLGALYLIFLFIAVVNPKISNTSVTFISFSFIFLAIFIFYIVDYQSKFSLTHIFHGLLLISILLTLQMIIMKVLDAPFKPWNAERLAWAYSISIGHPFYASSPKEGPFLACMYAPFTAIFYIPAVLSGNIIDVLRKGTIFSFLIYFIPSSMIIFKGTNFKNSLSITAKTISFALFIFFTMHSKITSDIAGTIHSNAPVIGFCFFSCFFSILALDHKNRNKILLFFSAFFSALAIFTKQIYILLPIGILLYFLFSGHRKLMRNFLVFFVFSFVFLSILTFNIVDFHNMLFRIVFLPRSIIMKDFAATLPLVLRELSTSLKLPFLLLLPSLVFYVVGKNFYHISLFKRIFLNKHGFLLFLGLFLSPIAIVPRFKMGGAGISLAPLICFLSLSASIFAGEVFMSIESSLSRFKLKYVFYFIIGFFLLLPVFTFSRSSDFFSIKKPKALEAFEYNSNHPDEIYFPVNPLSVLMSTGKAYHDGSVLLNEVILSNKRSILNTNRIFSNIPPNFKYIAFPNEHEYRYYKVLMRAFPEFTKRISLSELPAWVVFKKPK